MAVMPADHVIPTTDKFRAAIAYAAELVAQDPTRLITFGIKPSYAAESFGYIELGEALPRVSAPDAAGTDAAPKDLTETTRFDAAGNSVESIGRGGDVLIAISTSGNSGNILRAAQEARSRDLMVVALTGETLFAASVAVAMTVCAP